MNNINDKPSTRNLVFGELATDILEKGNCLRFCARGKSMAPSIGDGDIVMVEPVKVSQLCVDDIVFYRCGTGQHVAHRLVGKTENEGTLVLTTKGDNLKYLDGPVLPEQILGRIIQIEAKSRRLRVDSMVGWLISRLLRNK